MKKSLNEVKDSLIGEVGTPRRDAFEVNLKKEITEELKLKLDNALVYGAIIDKDITIMLNDEEWEILKGDTFDILKNSPKSDKYSDIPRIIKGDTYIIKASDVNIDTDYSLIAVDDGLGGMKLLFLDGYSEANTEKILKVVNKPNRV